MPKHEGEGLLQGLVSAFQDANLGMSRYRSFPYVQDETAQSHLFRIMEFWNIETWDNISTNAISKEVILTLLQCAARLYEDKIHANAAMNLIQSTHTRAILSLAIQDVLCRVANQRYIENIRSDKSEDRTAENHIRRVDMFSAIRRTKARQLNYQAMIFEHISSLCHSHGSALQNPFDIPRSDERFMFHNYVTLSKAFNRYEKSWLVTLLPGIFKWEDQDSGDGTHGGELLAPNFGSTKEAKEDVSFDAPNVNSSPTTATTTPKIIRDVNVSWDETVSLESAESLHWSLPWAPLFLAQASTTTWKNELRAEPGASDSDSESFALTNKVLEFEKWMDLLRKRTIKYPRSTSAGTVTSPLHEPNEFHDQLLSQNEERRPVGITIVRKDDGNYFKEWNESLLSPSIDIPDRDWELLGSGDDSENIFRFSPDAHNDSKNGNIPSLSSDANSEPRVRMSSTKDAQESFSFVSFPCLQSNSKDKQRRSTVLEPGEWMRGHQSTTRLPIIHEEPQGQIEVEGRHNEPKRAPKMAATSLPSYFMPPTIRKPLKNDPCSGVGYN